MLILFYFSKHIKQNINNILVISTKCKEHNANIMHYCKICKEYLCNYCIINDNIHGKKNIQNLYELIPSKAQIRKIENRIK